MKRIYLLLYVLTVIMSSAAQNSRALTVDEILWSTYASELNDNIITEDENNPKLLLLFCRSAVELGFVGRSDAFVANGGDYGMQGILSNIGNRYYITRAKNEDGSTIEGQYVIHSNTTNKAIKGLNNNMSINKDEGKIFMDRGYHWDDNISYPNWKIERDKTMTDRFCYSIQNGDYYNDNENDANAGSYAQMVYDNDLKRVGFSFERKAQWCFIPEDTYREVILKLPEDSYVEVSGYIRDGGFNRFNDYENQWRMLDENGNNMDMPTEIDMEMNRAQLAEIAEKLKELETINSTIKAITDIIESDEYKNLKDNVDNAEKAYNDNIEQTHNLVARKEEIEKQQGELNALITELEAKSDLTEDEEKQLSDAKTNLEKIGTEWTEVVNKIQTLINSRPDLEQAAKEAKEELKNLFTNKGIDLGEKTPDDKIKELEGKINDVNKLTLQKEYFTYYDHIIGATGLETVNDCGFEGVGAFWEFWKKYGDDFCAGIYNKGEYTQTIEVLRAGTYNIVCSGINMNSNENTASFVVNGKHLPMPVMNNAKNTIYSDYKAQVDGDARNMMALRDGYYYQGLEVISAALLLNDATCKNDLSVNYYVEITEDDIKNGNNKITFGFSKNDNDITKPVFADNFRMFYTNMSYVAYISANKTDDNIEKYAYNKPVDLYVRRSFTNGAWNAIVLPYDITVGGLSEFGDGVKLSKLEGINPERPTQIKFVNTSELKAGECGLIYVPENSEPVFKLNDNETKTLLLLNNPIIGGKLNGTDPTKSIDVHGPLYVVHGVSRPENITGADETGFVELDNYDEATHTVTKIYTTSAGSLKFTGYYYKPGTKWKEHSYIMDGGNMYYLDSDWGTVYGTMWSLEDVDASNAQSARMVFEINGVVDNETTSIGGIVTDKAQGNISGMVYNLNGQPVGENIDVNTLPKGIYISNGRKYVVK